MQFYCKMLTLWCHSWELIFARRSSPVLSSQTFTTLVSSVSSIQKMSFTVPQTPWMGSSSLSELLSATYSACIMLLAISVWSFYPKVVGLLPGWWQIPCNFWHTLVHSLLLHFIIQQSPYLRTILTENSLLVFKWDPFLLYCASNDQWAWRLVRVSI